MLLSHLALSWSICLVHAGRKGSESGTILRRPGFIEATMLIPVNAYCAITILSFVLAFFFKGHLIKGNKLVH